MDDVTASLSSEGDDLDSGSSAKKSSVPRGMIGRWLAALIGASASSLAIGIAVARLIGESSQFAVPSGGFVAVCAWGLLAPAAIAQRSAAKAWALVVIALVLALIWMQWA